MTTKPDARVRRIYDKPDTRPQPVRRWTLVTRAWSDVDPVTAEAAAAGLLTTLGMDLNDPNLLETPRGMAQALLELTSRPDFELTTFPNDEG